MTKEEKLEKWLNECPSIVLSRIIEEPEYLKFLSSTTTIYDKNTLVVIPITLLEKLEIKIIKN